MARSLISPNVVRTLERVNLRAHETAKALQGGGVFIVWGRWNEGLQDHAAVGERYVTLTYANQKVSNQSSPSAASLNYDGTLESEAPWDLEVGDSFTGKVGEDVLTGTIKQIFPPTLGTIKATFTLQGGDRV